MILGSLLLLTGLTISAVAIYYSVLGLAAIFAAATIPIYIMGTTLEIAKLVAASWLKANWNKTKSWLKYYMILAVLVLMFITSMGIFGFLSKAHLDQSIVSGNNQTQLQEIDRQIAIEQRNIDDATRVINQLDQAVQALIDANRIRGSSGSIAVRKSQTEERQELNNIIKTSNSNISELQQKRLPLVQEKINLEAEVGPVKYIAAFIYGQNVDKDLLEKAVTWIIILIVLVFDPLAIVMLLAAQMTFQWYKESKGNKNEPISNNNDININLPKNDVSDVRHEPILENNDVIEKKLESEESDFDINKHPYLFRTGQEGFKNLKPMVYTEETTTEQTQETNIEITADSTLLHTTENVDITTTEIINNEDVKKKIYDQEPRATTIDNEEIIYVQNQEQNNITLWDKLRSTSVSEEFKPKDYLMVVYAQTGFNDIQYDPDTEPELDKFIKSIKDKTYNFGNYPTEKLKIFANKIYEFRKNKSDNSA